MNTYKCPKCETEFTLGTKFCEGCGCNLEVEFIETPTCPKCKKTFSAGTIFCSEDGTKLMSPEQMIPKCVKCEKVYTDGTKFCPLDGGKVIPEALRTGIDFDNAKEFVVESVGKGKELFNEYASKGNESFSRLSKNQKYGVIGGLVIVIVLVIVLATGGNNKRIIGTWEGRIGNCTIELTYYANGNFTQIDRCSNPWGGTQTSSRGIFVLRRNSITVTTDDISETSSIEFIDRNTFILHPESMPGIAITFRRQSE